MGIALRGDPAEAAMILYGIKNCETVKKARSWLEANGVAYRFHDYKSAGIDEARLRRWAGEAGWEKLINRSGTTYRKLPDVEKAELSEDRAISLMVAQPSMIRRPIVEARGKLLVGFDVDAWAATLP